MPWDRRVFLVVLKASPDARAMLPGQDPCTLPGSAAGAPCQSVTGEWRHAHCDFLNAAWPLLFESSLDTNRSRHPPYAPTMFQNTHDRQSRNPSRTRAHRVALPLEAPRDQTYEGHTDSTRPATDGRPGPE